MLVSPKQAAAGKELDDFGIVNITPYALVSGLKRGSDRGLLSQESLKITRRLCACCVNAAEVF